MLAGEELGYFVEALLEDFAKAEEDASSAKWRLGGPYGKGCGCSGDGCVDFGGSGQGDAGLRLSRRGIIDVAKSSRITYGCFAVDPMMNFAELLICGESGGEVEVKDMFNLLLR